ncbi:MAG: P-type conjugative transfer protein TrbL [Parvibaculaceae bacterium]|nr:P-type conjugative transfer protein TrbL [Parvibaculaceae bacterium]
MSDLSIIDTFMNTFSSYIDSGFGLLGGDVAFLSTTLIGIDVTLAGLFWALGGEDNVLARLIRKVLYVGAFAYIIENFQRLSAIVYGSFAGLGLKASGSAVAAADLLKPGKIAAVGYQAAHPLLDQVGNLVGFPDIFSNALTVFVLLVAWFLVIIAFFILAIQLFITVLEFKLTTLAGFVLVPFALWNKTAFLAERVLGNVISSGIKVMVLAVIVGIASTLFSTFTTGLSGQDADLAAAMSEVLGALTLLGLGIFGPGIAAGLVSGAPQLGAGAALGTAGAAVGAALLTGGAALAAGRMGIGGGLAAIRAGTAMGSAATSAYQLGQATSGASGMAGVGAGLGGVARAAGGSVMQGARSVAGRAASSLKSSADAGRRAAWEATGGTPTASMKDAAASTGGSSNSASAPSAPQWAQRLRSEQQARAHRHSVEQAVKDGDRPGAGANPSLDDKEV